MELLDDLFVRWLSFANAGMLHGGNVWCLDYAIQNLPSDAPIVEIGSFCGLSTNAIQYLKLKHGKSNQLFCSDAWKFEGAGSTNVGNHPHISFSDYREFVKSTFIRNVSFFNRGDLPSAIELLSDDFFEEWRKSSEVTDVFGKRVKLGGPISFAYIDGNHTYEFCKRDFQNVDRFLEVGGFVLFDDSADESDWEVKQVILEVKDLGRYEVIKQNPNYLFRKLKHESPEHDKYREELLEFNEQPSQNESHNSSDFKSQANPGKLAKAQAKVERLRRENDRLKEQLQARQAEITAMQTSKFWKLRAQWFKLKKILGMAGD